MKFRKMQGKHYRNEYQSMTGTWCRFTGTFLKAYAGEICAQADMQGDIDHTLYPQLKAVLARRRAHTVTPSPTCPLPGNLLPSLTNTLPVEPPSEATLPIQSTAEVPNLNGFFLAPQLSNQVTTTPPVPDVAPPPIKPRTAQLSAIQRRNIPPSHNFGLASGQYINSPFASQQQRETLSTSDRPNHPSSLQHQATPFEGALQPFNRISPSLPRNSIQLSCFQPHNHPIVSKQRRGTESAVVRISSFARHFGTSKLMHMYRFFATTLARRTVT
jgi:hypothetical protein